MNVRRHSGALNRLLSLVLCSALILSLTPVTAFAAEGVVITQVATDGAPTSGTGAATATSVSFAHTTGSGSDRLLLVGVSWNCGTTSRTVASVTFTPTSGSPIDLTLVKHQQAGTQLRYSAIYSLLNPPASTAGTVNITFSGAVSSGIVAGAASFAGVDQANPLGVAAGAGSPSQSTAPAVTLTGLEGDELVFDTVFQGGTSSSQTLTAGSGQTELWNAFSGNSRAAASTAQATGPSLTMSWTAASNGYWAIAAVPINPAVGVVTHQLSMSSSPADGGATSPVTGAHSYPEGEVVDVSAVPSAGYAFDYWTGDVADPNAASTTVTMDSEKVATAHFSVVEYTLSAASDGNGTVTKTPDQATYLYGDDVELTAIPDPGWEFTGWSGDLSGGLTPQTVTVQRNSSVTAHFEPYELVPLALDGAVSQSTGAASASSVSITHTTGTGTDRLMLVGVSWNCGTTDRTVASATFTPDNGSPAALAEVFTQLGANSSGNPRYSAIYSLLDPPRNVTGTVAVTFSGTVGNGIVAGAANFEGVDQADPLGTPSGAASTSGTSPTVTLTGLDGDEIVFDNVFQGGSDSAQTLTAGDGQTGLWDDFVGNNRTASSIEQATGDSVTMSWEAASAGVWAIAAVPINPVVPPEPTDIAGATIAPIPDQTYTGSAITPAVTVTLGSDTLVEDTDYTVAYEDDTGAGTATVTLTGIGDYTGTKSANFTIAKATPSVTAWPSASSITLGQALSASTLTGGTHSVPGTFTFVDPTTVPLATGPYTAAVTFTPTDSANYNSVGGTIEVQVNEAPADIAGAIVYPIPDQTYNGSAITPAVTVELGAVALVKDTDYTVAYASNTNAGTATVTLTGIGDYTGTKNANFTIAKATPILTWPSASAITLGQALSASTLIGGTHSVPGAFAFVDPGRVPLVAGSHLATVIFVPTDSANYYSVSETVQVQVNPAPVAPISLSSATVARISNRTYTGSAIKPSVTVTVGGRTLVVGTDYKVAYARNTYAGTATVTITGIGRYAGTKVATFKIVPKKSAISKLKAGSRKVTVSWKKHSGASGYQVAYSKSKTKSFKYASRTSKSTKTVYKLKRGVRYYFKVRAYETIGGTRYYGKWSTTKSMRVK